MHFPFSLAIPKTWKEMAKRIGEEQEWMRAGKKVEEERKREAAKKAEAEKSETTRAMGRVLGKLSHTRERLYVEEEQSKKLEGEVKNLRAELLIAEQKEKEVQDVEMGGTGSSSQRRRRRPMRKRQRRHMRRQQKRKGK